MTKFNGVSISSEYLSDAEKMSCAVLAIHLNELAKDPLVVSMGSKLAANEYKSLLKLEIEQRVQFCSLVGDIMKKIAESVEAENRELKEKLQASIILEEHARHISLLREKFSHTRNLIINGDYSFLKVKNSNNSEILPKEITIPKSELKAEEAGPVGDILPVGNEPLKRPEFTSTFAREMEAERMRIHEERNTVAFGRLTLADVVDAVPVSCSSASIDDVKVEDSFEVSASSGNLGDTAFIGSMSGGSSVRKSLVSSLDGSFTVDTPHSKQRGLCYYSPLVSKAPPPRPNFDDTEDFNDQNVFPSFEYRNMKMAEPSLDKNPLNGPLGTKDNVSSGVHVQRPKFMSSYGQLFNK